MKTAIAASIFVLLAACSTGDQRTENVAIVASETTSLHASDYCTPMAEAIANNTQLSEEELLKLPQHYQDPLEEVAWLALWADFPGVGRGHAEEIVGILRDLARNIDADCGTSLAPIVEEAIREFRCATGHHSCVPATTAILLPTTTRDPYYYLGGTRAYEALQRVIEIRQNHLGYLDGGCHDTLFSEGHEAFTRCHAEAEAKICEDMLAWKSESEKQGYTMEDPELSQPSFRANASCSKSCRDDAATAEAAGVDCSNPDWDFYTPTNTDEDRGLGVILPPA